MTDIFSNQGALSKQIDNFKYRPEQVSMAQTIFAACNDGHNLICEAGTGTGKTIAYLVPILLSGHKTIISTGTRHLQDQIYQKDLPVVLDALDLSVNTAVLKGRANYLCLARMENTLNNMTDLNHQEIDALQKVAHWSVTTIKGDINELDELEENSRIHGLITSTIDNCLGQNCAHFDQCFVFKNRKMAMEADLIISNHYLVLNDMILRENGFGEVLPLTDIIVFDEAHQLPELASIHFSQRLSTRQILELIDDTREANIKEAGDIIEFPTALDQLERTAYDIRLAFGQKTRRISWRDTCNQGVLPKTLHQFMDQFQKLIDVLEPARVRGHLLDNCYQRALQHYHFIEHYTEQQEKDCIFWVEVTRQHVILNKTPVHVASVFQRHLSHYHACTIFTSASLIIDNKIDHFKQQLGLKDTESCMLKSPFDYQKQSMLYIPYDLPDPADEEFFNAFVQRTTELLILNHGHAFILFTSYRSLQKASLVLKKTLTYPLFIQGNAPRLELLNQFRATKHAVLLGTNSFWEGVNVKGDALSLVIIEKLPFANLNDPVLQAKLNYLYQQDINAFLEYQVPQAAIVLKQGVGRLIRDTDDKGVCAICDKRVLTKNYGKKILSSLPDMPLTNEFSQVEHFLSTKNESIL